MKSPKATIRSGRIAVVFVLALFGIVVLPRGDAQAINPQAARSGPASERLVGYYGDWYRDCSNCLHLGKLQWGKLNDLIYAFATPKDEGCSLPDLQGDAHYDFPVIRHERERFPRLRVLLSVGGAGAAGYFESALSTDKKTAELASNCASFVQTHKRVFDGIDVDWERPANATGAREFTNLMVDLRKDLGPRAPLTAAVTDRYPLSWKKDASVVSWFNLMTYDYHGAWDTRTDFNAPLDWDPSDPSGSPSASVAFSVNALIRYGVPSVEILLGIPFYGRGYLGVSQARHGLYQKYSLGKGAGTAYPYSKIVLDLRHEAGFTRYGPDPHAAESWLYKTGPHGKGVFIGYDGVSSMRAKARFAIDHNLGGVMVWNLGDDAKGSNVSLLRALSMALKPGTAILGERRPAQKRS